MKMARVRSVPSIGKDNHVVAAVLAAIETFLEEENRVAAAVLATIEVLLDGENRARRREGPARLNRWRKTFRRRGTLVRYRWSAPGIVRRTF